jgi:ADP-ribosylglycohydrolase
MIDTEEVARSLGQRRTWIRRLWCDEQVNDVVYREVEASVKAMANKGFDTSRAEVLLPAGEALFRADRFEDLWAVVCEIRQALHEAPRTRQPEGAPAALEEIQATWPRARSNSLPQPRDYFDQVLGGWQGKNIGGSLGGILEGWTRSRIVEKYGYVDDFVQKPPSTLNDDIAFELVYLHALEEYGLDLSSAQLGREWVAHLPLDYCYTAERVAMENLLRGLVPPDSGIVDNPFSEWIGAQMKAEICGLIAPGRPDLAAEYAYRDGIVAHEREGVYGELFVAAATSLAFVMEDMYDLVEAALQYVPPCSRYASTVRQVIAWCQATPDWQEVCRRVEETYGEQYHWVHVLPNAAVVVLALLCGKGDFGDTVAIATTCGFDVDCNAGVAGAIVGVLRSSSGIPNRFKVPIGDQIDTWVSGFERVSLADLARRTCLIGERLLQEKGRLAG